MAHTVEAFDHAQHAARVWPELEARVDVRTTAGRTLAGGLEQSPGAAVDDQRRSPAAHLATELLMAVDRPSTVPAGDGPDTAEEARRGI